MRRCHRRKRTKIASPPSVTFRVFAPLPSHQLHQSHPSHQLHQLHRLHPSHLSHLFHLSHKRKSPPRISTRRLSSASADIPPPSIHCAPSRPDILSLRAFSTSSPSCWRAPDALTRQ